MKTIVTGDSHVWAVLGALKERPAEDRAGIEAFFLTSAARVAKPFHEALERGVRFTDPGMTTRLARHTAADMIQADPDTLWIFSLGLHSAGWFRDSFWSNAAPAHMGVKGQAVSSAVLNRSIESATVNYWRFIDDLISGAVRFMILSAPPPRRDHYAFRKQVRIPVRMEVNRIFRNHIASELARRGVPLILPPPESVDEDGFLKSAFRHAKASDQHHANPDYGELVLQQILPLLGPGDR